MSTGSRVNGNQFTRRYLLKGAAVAGGATLLPARMAGQTSAACASPAQKALTSLGLSETGSLIWTAPARSPLITFVNGQLIVTNLQTGGKTLWVLDTKTGTYSPQISADSAISNFEHPTGAGSRFFYFAYSFKTASNNLICLDLITGTETSLLEGTYAQYLTVYGNLLIFSTVEFTSDRNPAPFGTYAFDVNTLQRVWYSPYGGRVPVGAPALTIVNGLIYTFGYDADSSTFQFFVLDANTGNPVRDPLPVNVTFSLGQRSNVPASIDSLMFISSVNALVQLDLITGKSSAFWNSNGGASISSPGAYKGYIYVGDSAGSLTAISAVQDTGSPVGTIYWSLPLGGDLSSAPPFIEDGYAYVCGDKVYGADLTTASRSNIRVVSYNPGSGTSLLGVNNGVVYCGFDKNTQIAAVNLGSLEHGFFAESELMADDYSAGLTSSSSTPSTPTFRTHLQLLDPSKNPRVNKAVKIWSNLATTITVQGQTSNLAPGEAVWTSTDGAGEISFITPASGISSPGFYLWADFMAMGEAIVIYPDHDLMGTLAGVTGDKLNQAKSYDKNDLLPSAYQGSAGQIAQAVQSTMGNTSASLATTRAQLPRAADPITANGHRRPPTLNTNPDAYIAYPQSNSNMLFQPVLQPSTDRAYVPGSIANWHLSIGENSATFTDLGDDVPPATDLPGFSLDLEAFVENVVNGAENLISVTVSKVEQTVTHLIQSAKNTYSFVVDTVEKAATVVSGLLKSIAGALARVVEALSQIFNLAAISELKNQIYTTVSSSLTNLQTAMQQNLKSDIQYLRSFFSKAQSELNGWASQFTGTSAGNSAIQCNQSQNNNPQSLYGAGGGKSYTQSRWLTSKVSESSQASTLSFVAPTEILSALDSILTAFKNSSWSDNTNLQTALNNCKQSLSQLLSDPTQFAHNALSVFVNVLVLVGDVVLQAADDLVEAFLTAVVQAIEAILSFFTTPISIPIPGLSSLLGNFSLLDLACWMVAIPAHLISSAFSLQAVQGGNAVSSALKIAMVVAEALYAAASALADAISSRLLTAINFVLSLVEFGISLTQGALNPNSSAFDRVFLGLQLLQFLQYYLSFSISVSLANSAWITQILWNKIGDPLWNLAYGILMVILSFVGAYVVGTSGYVGVALAKNILYFFSYCDKFLKLVGEAAVIALVVINYCCLQTVTCLDIAALIHDGVAELEPRRARLALA